MSLFRSSAVVGGFTASSRVLGFVRDALMAARLGDGPVAEAFFAAFRLPNLFRRILAEGALNSAFVPRYARHLEESGQARADEMASEVVSFLAVVLIGLIVVAQLTMPFVMIGLMPGKADDADWVARATVLGMLTMPYIGFMSLMALYGGTLNAHHRFAAFAAAPVLLNVVLIGLLVSPIGEEWDAARWLAGGVFAAGLLQWGLVAWGVRRAGIRLRFQRPRWTGEVKKVVTLGIPGAIAAGVTQINIVISQQLASFVDGAVAWLNYADRLYQLPLGVIGIAMGIVLLPTLTRRLRAGDEAGANDSMNRGLEIAAFFTLPAAMALVVVPDVWVIALFEHGRFTAEATARTAPLVAAFGLGVPFFVAIKVFAPGFFAREDTRRPMRFAIVAVIANIVLGATLFLGTPLGVTGLAVATTVAAMLNTALLAGVLRREGHWKPDGQLLVRTLRLLGAALLMGAVLLLCGDTIRGFLRASFVQDLAVATGFALFGLAIYAGTALLAGAIHPRELKHALQRTG